MNREWLLISTPESVSSGSQPRPRFSEKRRWDLQEAHQTALKIVQNYEERLDISHRWASGSEMRIEVEKRLAKKKYQKCVDNLEGLSVQRLFEMEGMNKPYLSQFSIQTMPYLLISCQTTSFGAILGQLSRLVPVLLKRR